MDENEVHYDMKIGVAVITYKRPQYLYQCLSHLLHYNEGGSDIQIVVADELWSSDYTLSQKAFNTINFNFAPHKNVASTKNRALKYLLEQNCDWLFLLEDDILITSCDVFKQYINYGIKQNAPHLNFAHHGPANKGCIPKSYQNWTCCYHELTGSMSMYTKDVIEKVGYFDETFQNAYEHVEHSYRISLAGAYPPFGLFADLPNSKEHLIEIPGSIDNSSIAHKPEWRENISNAEQYWIRKYGQFQPPRIITW